MSQRLLLIHGFLSSPQSWGRLQHHLHGRVETVAPELAGYGRTPGPRRAGYTLEALADALEPVLEHERPTHVLGHSMGAIVALEIARRHPGRFDGIGVLGIPVYSGRADALEYLHLRGPVHRALMRSDAATHVLCRTLSAGRWAWAPAVPWLFPGRPLPHIQGALRHSRAGHGGALDGIVFAGNVPRLAGAVEQQVTALHAPDDRAAPLDRAQSLAETHGWHFAIAPSGGHQLMVTRPRLVARWVRNSLLGEPPPLRRNEGFSQGHAPPTLAP